MNEPQRARAIKVIQLELFERKRELERIAEQIEMDFRARLELVSATGTKICRKVGCRKEKPVSEFYQDDRYADSRYPYCRDCKRKMNREGHRKAA